MNHAASARGSARITLFLLELCRYDHDDVGDIVENDSTHPEDGLTWDQLTRGRSFITNLGYQPNYTQSNPNGPPMLMGRFAAFLPLPEDESRHQIVEVSHDLDYLKHKYAVTDDAVFQVNLAAS